MKYIFLVLVWSIFSIVANAQNDSINISKQPTGTIVIEDDYTQIKHFLLSLKNNSDHYFVKKEHSWNSKLYQEQIQQWYTINRKKELAAAILIDNRFVIQTMPTGYYEKDLRWISPSKQYDYRDSDQYINRPFIEQVATDIIYNVTSDLLLKNKYHSRYSASATNKAYATPSFLKF